MKPRATRVLVTGSRGSNVAEFLHVLSNGSLPDESSALEPEPATGSCLRFEHEVLPFDLVVDRDCRSCEGFDGIVFMFTASEVLGEAEEGSGETVGVDGSIPAQLRDLKDILHSLVVDALVSKRIEIPLLLFLTDFEDAAASGEDGETPTEASPLLSQMCTLINYDSIKLFHKLLLRVDKSTKSETFVTQQRAGIRWILTHVKQNRGIDFSRVVDFLGGVITKTNDEMNERFSKLFEAGAKKTNEMLELFRGNRKKGGSSSGGSSGGGGDPIAASDSTPIVLFCGVRGAGKTSLYELVRRKCLIEQRRSVEANPKPKPKQQQPETEGEGGEKAEDAAEAESESEEELKMEFIECERSRHPQFELISDFRLRTLIEPESEPESEQQKKPTEEEEGEGEQQQQRKQQQQEQDPAVLRRFHTFKMFDVTSTPKKDLVMSLSPHALVFVADASLDDSARRLAQAKAKLAEYHTTKDIRVPFLILLNKVEVEGYSGRDAVVERYGLTELLAESELEMKRRRGEIDEDEDEDENEGEGEVNEAETEEGEEAAKKAEEETPGETETPTEGDDDPDAGLPKRHRVVRVVEISLKRDLLSKELMLSFGWLFNEIDVSFSDEGVSTTRDSFLDELMGGVKKELQTIREDARHLGRLISEEATQFGERTKELGTATIEKGREIGKKVGERLQVIGTEAKAYTKTLVEDAKKSLSWIGTSISSWWGSSSPSQEEEEKAESSHDDNPEEEDDDPEGGGDGAEGGGEGGDES